MVRPPRERSRFVCAITPLPPAGKTDLALALAERVPLEIISMDSALVYRGLDIGTAKPSAAVRAAAAVMMSRLPA